MSRFIDWAVWHWDLPTAWTAFLLLQFFALEFLTSGASPIGTWRGEMVTDHLRPLFHAAPITWWLALGLWLWVGPHFLFPALEELLQRTVSGS